MVHSQQDTKKNTMRLLSALFIFPIFLAVIVMIVWCIYVDNKPSVSEYISSILDVSIEDADVARRIETHGGFLGDGTSFYIIKYNDDSIIDEIRNNNHWIQLPINDDNLNILLYGESIKQEYKETGPLFCDSDGKGLFPEIKNGYYFFKNKNSESSDVLDSSGIIDRVLFNFTVAVYDEDNRILYFGELDT